jgi:ergothioneine biosynthesis protein EgtB
MGRVLLQADTREALASRLDEARSRTDEIFRLLEPDALYERPIPERHRLVFYLGHVEAFDWNLIARQGFGLEPFDEKYDQLFAFGIDPIGGGLPNEPASDWPRREVIEKYNRRVREIVDECVRGTRPHPDEREAAVLFNMAIEHRLMHAETLAYLIHRLPYEAKRPEKITPAPEKRHATVADRVEIPAGRATLGRKRETPGFGWDNECEEVVAEVPAFVIDRHKITNGRFLEFIEDGGYQRRPLWSDRDWTWKEHERLTHPGFWHQRDGLWFARGMFEETPLDYDGPVYVSHAEASAFARWSERALPSEAQFHRAAYGTREGAERSYPWGEDEPESRHGNFDFQRWDPTPVGSHPDGDSAFGVSELLGNGWEWTRTTFEAFPGFKAHPYYAGYSANFFDGEHYVMKGGSPRTAACMLRRAFRNWFQPHYGYVYSAFRLVDA